MPASGQKSPDGRQARWHQHNETRRQEIIDAAIDEIEAVEPGAEVHVQQIADRAGLSRTVVYRHFHDRADLDRAVQVAVLEGLWAALLPGVALDGTVPQIIERIVSTYVGWAVAHPALHRFAEQDTSLDGVGPLQQGIERLADRVSQLIVVSVDLLELQASDDERAAIDPLVFGLVGAVFGAVRRWMSKTDRTPPADVLVELVTRSVWHILHGHALSLGVMLDPDVPVEDLLQLTGTAAGA
ncbi:MAG: TetR/AcrR family transcriptional regulator [Nocardioides sp.]|nr:TetR/AcrR family transcriptional regulator [Nocardioides sp.]